MYNSKEILREYVQNAVDACVKYEKETGKQERTIQIRIDADNKSIVVFDRGIGMNEADIKSAKSIAVSPKLEDNDDYVGFRGIGIWAGLAACERLEVISTKINDPFIYKLTIKCKDIVENYTKPIDIGELMKGRFQVQKSTTDPNEHYTFVKMVDVYGDYEEMLKVDDMTKAVSQNLPVEIDPNWGSKDHQDKLKDILSEIPMTSKYNITVNGNSVYRYFPSNVGLPEKEIIKDKHGNEIAIAWFARSLKPQIIKPKKDSYEVTNFAVRVKNFTVGERLLYIADHQKNLLNWFTGEIYVVDAKIKPDTNRRLFNASTRAEAATEAIRNFYTLIVARSRAFSAEVTALDDSELVKTRIIEAEKLLTDNSKPEQLAVPRQKLVDLSEKINLYQKNASSQEKGNLYNAPRNSDSSLRWWVCQNKTQENPSCPPFANAILPNSKPNWLWK